MDQRKTKKEEFILHIPAIHEGQEPRKVSLEIEVYLDPAVGEWLVTPESQKLIEDTKASYMGLLRPEELKHLRKSLGLTQQQISELLQIGDRSWTRWESGKQRPSRAVNLLILALQDGRITIDYLKQKLKNGTSWADIIPFPHKKERKPLSMHDVFNQNKATKSVADSSSINKIA